MKAMLFSRATRRRRFWCALSRREVEVEFEEWGLPGLRQPVAVRSCSVFDPPTAVTCGRRCLDPVFRHQWGAGPAHHAWEGRNIMELVAAFVVVLLVGPLLLIGAAALLLLATAIFPSSPRRIRETFHCPWTGRVVTADFLVPEGAPHPSDVVSCSAFSNPEQVMCTKPCRELAEVRWGLSRAVFPRWALIADGLVTWRSPTE